MGNGYLSRGPGPSNLRRSGLSHPQQIVHLEWHHAAYGQIPPFAFEGGYDRGPLYVGRAYFGRSLIPGKVQPSHHTCYIPYGGREYSLPVYEVLCDSNYCHLHWVHASNGFVPRGAVQGGYTSLGELLFIGRCIHLATQPIGKVQPSHRCLYFSYQGEEIPEHFYEVLVCS